MTTQEQDAAARRSEPRTESERLDSLTGLRFFAALWVVLLHTTILLDARLLGWNLWSYGGLGVSFFFLLSGFVLTWTAKRGDSARAFWRRRVARVVPLYYAMLLIGAVVFLVMPIPAGHFPSTGTSAQNRVLPVISLTMIQGWVSPHTQLFLSPSRLSPNPPAWSISDEAFFYALFPVMVLIVEPLRRRGAAVLFALAIVFLLYFYWMVSGASWLTTFPPYQLGFFVAGMATAVAVKRQQRFPPLPAVLVGVGVLAAAMYLARRHLLGISTNGPLYEIILVPFMAVLLGSAAQADLARRWSPFRGRWLVTLGVWSFALYLVQIPCFVVASCVFPTGLSANRIVAVGEEIAFLCFAITAAGLAHRLIELPWNKRLRHAPESIILEQEHRSVRSDPGPPRAGSDAQADFL